MIICSGIITTKLCVVEFVFSVCYSCCGTIRPNDSAEDLEVPTKFGPIRSLVASSGTTCLASTRLLPQVAVQICSSCYSWAIAEA